MLSSKTLREDGHHDQSGKNGFLVPAHRQGGVRKGRHWTLDEWMRHVYANQELAPRTRETALEAWGLYTHAAFKVIPLRDLQVEDVDRELDRLRTVTSRYDRPLAPRTRALWYANLRRALNVAMKKRLIAVNPCLLTDRAPSSDKSTERPRWSKRRRRRS